jgi:ABC-type multidrug transport system ATPase subunit
MLPSQITLFDNLTPIDHLELYSRLKGNTPNPEERIKQ